MPLRRRTRQTVTVKRPLLGYGGNAFEAEGHTLKAAVQPMSGTATAEMYGLQPGQTRLLLCHRDAELRLGDGVCVDVEAQAEPDFRVIYMATWAWHVAAHLRYIPEQERGVDEL